MTTTTCEAREDRCPNPTADGVRLCESCVINLANDLDTVDDDLLAELDVVLSRQHRLGADTGTRVAGGERPLSVHIGALNAKVALSKALRAALVAVGDTGAVNDVIAGAERLGERLNDLRVCKDAGEHHDAVLDAVRRAWRVIDGPAERVVLGTCGAWANGEECEQQLNAEPGVEFVVCTECGTRWEVTVRRDRMRDIVERSIPVTATQAEGLLLAAGESVSASQIRNLASRGRVHKVGLDKAGNPTYLVTEIRRAIEDRYQRVTRTMSTKEKACGQVVSVRLR